MIEVGLALIIALVSGCEGAPNVTVRPALAEIFNLVEIFNSI